MQFAKSWDKKIGLFVQRSNFLGFPDLDFTFWKSMTFQDVNDPMNHDGATFKTVMFPVGLQSVLSVSSVTNFHFFFKYNNVYLCSFK